MAETIHFFKLIRELFRKMGIHPCGLNQIHNYNSRNSLILIILGQLTVASATFLLVEAKSIEEYGQSFYLTTTSLLLLYLLPCFIHNMGDLFNLMDQMDKFGQKRDGSISKFMHGKVNERIERVTKLTYIYYCEVYIGLGLLSAFIQTVVNYYVVGLGDESFYLPVLLVLPFNWRTPFGYVIALITVIVAATCTQIFFSLILCFHVGFCWLIISFVKDITNDLEVLTQKGRQNRRKMIVIFYKSMDLYSNVKQMVVKFNQVYEFVPTGFILWCLSTICIALLLIQMKIGNTEDFAGAFNSLMLVNILLGIIFILTEFGEMVNNQFAAFDDKLCECVWYRFPLKTQQIFCAFMMYSQNAIIIQGFGNTKCTRDTFKNVVHASWSYFMVLRQLK